MSDLDQFTNTFGSFVHRSAYTPGQLAGLSSVPKTTIVNWLRGRVRRPRSWEAIVGLAAAMRLTEAETNQLLAAAQHPSLQELKTTALDETMGDVLRFWQTAVSPPPPFQAIPLPPYFVGREAERNELKAALTVATQTAVTCLHGMAGVGKTSLAAQMAYQLRHHFADGVLWARLDSSDTMSILATFAAAYQQDVSQYHDIASRSRVVRNLLMARHALIVLDNVQTSQQIEPLLPPTGRCAVLITTRRQDLAILVGANRFEIRPFAASSATSLRLFAKLLGHKQVQANLAQLESIATDLGHLPLALLIAASRLAYELGWQISEFNDRVKNVSQRLHALRYETQSVRRSFQLSYDLLDGEAQHLYAAIGLLGRQPFSVAVLAAITQSDEEAVADGLHRLYSLSLVQSGPNGRFTLHPLLHDYAQSLGRPDAAAHRALDYWVSFVAAHRYDHVAIARELGHVELGLQTAVAHRWIRPLLQLLKHLIPFFMAQGRYDQAEAHLAEAASVLAAHNEATALAWHRLWLGQLAQQRHALDAAEQHLHQSLQLAQQAQDVALVARCLTELGVVQNCRGNYEQGHRYLTQALPLARQEAVEDSLLKLLEELGILALLAGETSDAAKYYQEGYDLAEAQGDEVRAVMFLKGLGTLYHLAKDREAAKHHFEKGLAIAQRIGFCTGLMVMANNIGVVAYYLDDLVLAKSELKSALAYAEQINDFTGMAFIFNNLARLARQNGRLAQSRAYFEQILSLAQEYDLSDAAQEARNQLAQLEQPSQEHLKVFI
ncbi:MAG: SARP family transcriptional regulator [Ardenticatenaceae bacterium]|nr:MAG: SARP family transcriptional regulator [Ardenticatenaceae bacterium]